MTESENKTNIPAKIWSSWEVYGLRLIVRFLVMLFFILYVLLTVQGAMAWVKMSWIRSQDFSRLATLVAAAEKMDDFSKVEDWIRLRPLSETDEIMKQLEPVTSQLPGTVFNEYTMRLQRLKRDEEVLFWHQYARFRLRYDALRCGVPDSANIVSAIQTLFPNEVSGQQIADNPALVAKSIRQVLDYDAKYPARDNPFALCKSLNKMHNADYPMSPPESWADVRYTLRLVTEAALEKMEKAPPEAPPPEQR